MGHPLGASGARILTHLTHELIRTKKKYAVGAACIGGGQGIAVIIENVALQLLLFLVFLATAYTDLKILQAYNNGILKMVDYLVMWA